MGPSPGRTNTYLLPKTGYNSAAIPSCRMQVSLKEVTITHNQDIDYGSDLYRVACSISGRGHCRNPPGNGKLPGAKLGVNGISCR